MFATASIRVSLLINPLVNSKFMGNAEADVPLLLSALLSIVAADQVPFQAKERYMSMPYEPVAWSTLPMFIT
jgi:predicted metal-dependent HD superfamily phosphohydrolase